MSWSSRLLQSTAHRRLVLGCVAIVGLLAFNSTAVESAGISPVTESLSVSGSSSLTATNQGFRNNLVVSSISSSSLKAENFLGANKKLLTVHDDPDNAPHWLVGSYYTIENGLTATLMLNNKGVAPLVVQPTLYGKNEQQFVPPPVVVEGNSFRNINLSDWVQIAGSDFREGNIRLFHTGKNLVLGAQIYLVDEANSFSFEEKLAELGTFDSRRLEGIFSVPSKQTKIRVVLTNTSSDPLFVTGRLTGESGTYGPRSITLSPNETRVLDPADIIPNNVNLSGRTFAISLEHNADNWALIGRVFLGEPSTGYSNLAQFYNPNGGAMSEYHGAGIQMRSPGGQRLKPIVVLRNSGSTVATVTGIFPYVRQNGSTSSITLPVTTLLPNQIKLLNTQQIELRNLLENIKFGSIELKYNTAPGSVGAAVHSESSDRDFVSRVPLWDPLKQFSPTGGYPWLIEGTSVTKNYIKNITERPQRFVGFYTWEGGGMYMLGEREVAPHQTVEIDAKQLRDGQIPDEEGRTIPAIVSQGQFQWTLKPEDDEEAENDPLTELALIGRSEQIDWGKNISNNYACQSCCVGNTIGSYLSPDSATVEVGSTVAIKAYLEEETCYGFPYSYQKNAAWSSDNTNTATVSSGTVTGQAVGNTVVRATYVGPRRIYYPPCPGGGPYLASCMETGEKNSVEHLKDETDLVAPSFGDTRCGNCAPAGLYQAFESASISVVATPQIEQVVPNGLVPGQSDVYVRIVGTNFGTSPTVNVTGGGVTAVYDIETPDGFEARFTIDENAQISERQLTVTANGRTSNAVSFTVGDRTPVITSISRSSASTGQTFSLDILGQHFGFNPTISISPPGISCANNSSTTTSINATCTVGTNASPGTRDIRVISHGITGTGFRQVPEQSDTSNAKPFQVTDVRPVISEVTYVEKNGLVDVTLSFEPGGAPNSETVELKLERVSGSGSATFENGSTVMDYTESNGSPQTFRIKGVTESSVVDNYKVTAVVNGNNEKEEEFTVAAITALEFERINTTGSTEQQDVPLDNNPGNGQPNTNVGQRIFPDKNTPGDGTDRATLRVKATVAPANVPNLRVYFASFDLDDPSASNAPIDTSGANGIDNNGATTGGSQSGEFSSVVGVTCANILIGSAPLYVGKIDCPASNTASSVNFKVTMQPGDNFAVAASLFDAYRNEIKVNTSAGENLINNANHSIPISGEANPNNVRGIRTKMLTVWRRLHIEVDSMGNVTGNNASGNFAAAQTIGTGDTVLSVTVATPLEINRFENGRLVIGGPSPISLNVVAATPTTPANTGTTVRVSNPGSPINVTPSDAFELFDDDDFNNNDGTTLIGDVGQDVPMLERTYLEDSDNPSLNHFAPAYIVPKYDIGNNNNLVTFGLNVAADTSLDTRALFEFNQVSTEASTDFWTIYLLSAYQYTIAEDEDPETNGATLARVDRIPDALGIRRGQGAAFFLETLGPKDCPALPGQPPLPAEMCNIPSNKLHEIGHLFGAEHLEQGPMDSLSTYFSDTSLSAIRRRTYP